MPQPEASIGAAARRPRDDEVDVFGLTHAGKVRTVNQDHFLISSLRKSMQIHHTSLPNVDDIPLEGERLAFLAMVADGVGGGVKGEVASRVAIAEVTQYIAHSMRCYYTADSRNEEDFHKALQEAAWLCHASVVDNADNDPSARGMATTLTVWIGVWPQAYVLQVGDSRFYVFRQGELTQLTRDQTMAQELLDSGVLTATEVSKTRWAHVLSSAIGGSQTAPVVTRIDQSWDNVGLLCSDGLTKHVPDEKIRGRLATMTSSRQVCETLLQDALDDGGTDNITIIVGRVVRRNHGEAANAAT
ncbi:MAG TPA: protein phosphatase 2C domain-containing protein [Gemmatimonadales bacterium]